MSTISTIPVSEAIFAMKRGEKIVFIQPKQLKKGKDGKFEAPKRYNGSLFFDVHFKVNVIMLKYKNAEGKIIEVAVPTNDFKPEDLVEEISRNTITKECKGEFTYTNLMTTRPPLDPENKEDNRHKDLASDGKPKPPSIQTSVKHGGELAEFAMLLRHQSEAAIKAAGAEGTVTAILHFDIEGLKIRPIIKTHVSKKAKENAGALLDDPILYIKSPMGKYPATYPNKALQNQRKSVFYDYSSRRVVLGKNGRPKEEFDLAVLLDDAGEPLLDAAGNKIVVDETNLHKYLKFGSIINKGRVNCGSICISNVGVSHCFEATSSVVTPSNGEVEEAEYEDDYVDEPLTEVVQGTQSTTQVTQQAKQAHTQVSATTANALNPAEAQVIDDLLDEL